MKSISQTTALVLIALSVAAPTVLAGETYVAKRDVQMKTATALFKFPVDAMRGERWELVKRTKSKVLLTFGPDDERRAEMAKWGMKKLPRYRLDPAVFDSAFVHIDEWPQARRSLAESLSPSLALSVEDKERLIEGEVWIGMSQEAAEVSVGRQVLKKATSETVDGVSEQWWVSPFGRTTSVELEVKTLHASGQDVSRNSHDEMVDATTRLVLWFTNGELVEIVRK